MQTSAFTPSPGLEVLSGLLKKENLQYLSDSLTLSERLKTITSVLENLIYLVFTKCVWLHPPVSHSERIIEQTREQANE